MLPNSLVVGFALLLGLSFFFGLAFEELYAGSGEKRPGGIRTFPLLALAGGMLYLLEPARLLPFAAGLVALGAWLHADYRSRSGTRDAAGQPNVGLMVPACNMLAYLLGALALAQPHWLVVGVTVAAVLLLTARERLHGLARRIEMAEIVTAGKFLILTGLVLPLLPDQPVTSLTTVTPYEAGLAVVAVSSLSYASYLLQRFVAPAESDLLVALLGGLYSSTATTVVLARRAGAEPRAAARARVGITLATAVMYLRIMAVVAVFNRPLAAALAVPMLALSLGGLALAGGQYLGTRRAAAPPSHESRPPNPLELTAAATFALLFIFVSIASSWVKAHFGQPGIDALAAIVGFTDIDPFVLSLAQGSGAAFSVEAVAAAILIATASNNVLKAGYAVAFAGWRASLSSALALVVLAAAAVGAALHIALP